MLQLLIIEKKRLAKLKTNQITEITKQVKLVCSERLRDSRTLEGSIDNLYFRKALKAKRLYGSLSLAAV